MCARVRVCEILTAFKLQQLWFLKYNISTYNVTIHIFVKLYTLRIDYLIHL